MLTAHLPAGYCLGKGTGLTGWSFAAVMVGSVFPDLDMLFFLFVDHGAIHHHRYWVHVPLFWAIVGALILPFLRGSRWMRPALAFLTAIFLHLLLDSISGGILWGAPFDSRLHALVTVPASQPHWILSFLLHWTFLLEILIWGLAGIFYARGEIRRLNLPVDLRSPGFPHTASPDRRSVARIPAVESITHNSAEIGRGRRDSLD